MGTYTVARDDFLNVRRSNVVLGVVGTFAALVGLVFVAEIDIYDDAYRTLWDVSALVGFAFPLFVAPLTYLAVAGDRERGSIKYLLGLPNSRLEYLVAKYVSRASIAVGAVLLGTLVGFVVAAATFANGADPVRFATFGLLSALYALAVAGTFVAVSATTASRSRSMFAVVGAYFVLVLFWNSNLLPVFNLDTAFEAIEALGPTVSQSTRDLVGVLSPTNAYLVSTEFVYAGVLDRYDVFATFTEQPD